MASQKMDAAVDAFLKKVREAGYWPLKALPTLEYAADERGWGSLKKLVEWLDLLDQAASEENRLKGIAYEKTFNTSLGFDKQDFTVFSPWGSWTSDYKRNYPTPLQKAFCDVLEQGKSNTLNPVIDLASLQPDLGFFLDEGKQGESDGKYPCVADAVANFVNNCPENSKPVIRFLVGTESAKKRKELWSGEKETLMTDIFWELKDGKRVPRIKHLNAMLYVGYYNPNFNPK